MLFYHVIMVLQSNIFLSNSSLTMEIFGQSFAALDSNVCLVYLVS